MVVIMRWSFLRGGHMAGFYCKLLSFITSLLSQLSIIAQVIIEMHAL